MVMNPKDDGKDSKFVNDSVTRKDRREHLVTRKKEVRKHVVTRKDRRKHLVARKKEVREHLVTRKRFDRLHPEKDRTSTMIKMMSEKRDAVIECEVVRSASTEAAMSDSVCST